METLVLTPPDDAEMTPEQRDAGSVFLAGTIEMGTGEDWQPRAIKALSGKVGALYNPRRKDWDSTWEQTIADPKFSEQVNWELDHIARADMVYFYFDPKSKSPITLLELGLVSGIGEKVAGAAPAVVCCPRGFWRRGNIEIICARYNIPLYEDFDESIGAVLTILRVLGAPA
jgi:hypothetical protein